jgi:hypothetical protein
VGGIVMTVSLVVGATAAALRLVDTVPAFLGGAARGRQPFASVEEVERRLQGRLLMPSYFPDRLQWPPATVALHGGRPAWVALAFTDRDGALALVLLQSVGAPDAEPPAVLTGGRRLHSTTVALHGSPAALTRLVDGEGVVWHEVSWPAGDRRVVLRSRGALDELLRMAGSVRARP